MDNTSRLRRLGPVPDRPLPYFVRAGGEKAAEVERLPHRGNHFGQRGLGA